MKDLFMFLLINMTDKLGTLTKTTCYGGDYATVEFEKDGSIFSVNISREDKKEEQQ